MSPVLRRMSPKSERIPEKRNLISVAIIVDKDKARSKKEEVKSFKSGNLGLRIIQITTKTGIR